ncbi:hypothetical protein [Virgisporangium aurantiacum]|uniref:Secreted protein n=1 Tax=Virgisporangium aurantiacum TaxID=175570 RepID=A0A8J4EAL9_9ACTN|nr:hypothetical protein [Virgisporangium aurantiacum]GIJ64917.1 hypothetical protein Vau01_124330 [Virgisporangium aurantiacum]
MIESTDGGGMTGSLDQISPLIGVVVGALLSFTATSLGERTRWRRSQQTRWDSDRLEAYAAYGEAVKRYIFIITRIAAGRGLPSGSLAIDPVVGLQELELAASERSHKWETMLLLGDADTIAAARQWQQSAWRLDPFALGCNSSPDEWSRALAATGTARDEFYVAARRGLGISHTLADL